MRRACAWCSEVLDPGEGPGSATTHGICDDCMAQVLPSRPCLYRAGVSQSREAGQGQAWGKADPGGRDSFSDDLWPLTPDETRLLSWCAIPFICYAVLEAALWAGR